MRASELGTSRPPQELHCRGPEAEQSEQVIRVNYRMLNLALECETDPSDEHEQTEETQDPRDDDS